MKQSLSSYLEAPELKFVVAPSWHEVSITTRLDSEAIAHQISIVNKVRDRCFTEKHLMLTLNLKT